MQGKERLEDALLKVALGFQVAEVTEEFAEVNGELKLTKRKRIKKDVPPDLKAVQLLLGENGGAGVETLSDDELEAERQRLIEVLKNTESKGQVCDESKKAVKKRTAKATETDEKAVEKKPRPKPRKRVVRVKKES